MKDPSKGAPESAPRTLNVALLYLVILVLQLVRAVDVEGLGGDGVRPVTVGSSGLEDELDGCRSRRSDGFAGVER